ncbi:MAG: hypothetical protein JNK84_20315 [Phreatobacter sp.]|uniref:hypothetical protein n=1 Tax=Phreatobacter sp. TaxID=1966341 RepID=UPI001A5D760B|nr:hypothetical protein [Phreatobacter sp.]MBL8571427.1 hypothetical protein [Phreatobacter sp.]
MFPDPDLEWHAYPSIIDGIKSPFAINKGQWEGKLHLLVVDNSTTPTGMAARSRLRPPAFGISIKCEIYLAVEEVLYCTAGHGDGWTRSYIKEARNSRLIAAISAHDPITRSLHPNTRVPRHFCFEGYDYCYETVGFHEPAIRPFITVDAGYAWVPGNND